MAGQPGFLRAKKLKFYHTDAKVKAVDRLTLEPTGSLVASPSGDFVMKSNVDMKASLNVDGNFVLAGNADVTGDMAVTGQLSMTGAGNTLTAIKKTIRASDFSAASTDESIKIWRASAGDVIHDVVAYIHQGFKYGATGTIVNITAGDWGDRDSYREAINCGSADQSSWIWTGHSGTSGLVGDHLWNASGFMAPYFVSNATDIFVKATASGTFFVSSLENGSLDVYLHTIRNQ